MHKYTQEEKDYLADIVPGRSRKEIAELFNNKFGTDINVKALGSSYKRFGLSTGRTGYFEKGNIPCNKGKKMPPEMYERSKATMFKKGNIPKGHRPVGSERISKDGYIEVKVEEPKKWKHKHVVEWEKHRGKVPKGMVVILLDGNRQNTYIDNLAIVNKATNARLNQNNLRFNDKQLTEAGINTAKLLTAIGKAKRKRNKKQNR